MNAKMTFAPGWTQIIDTSNEAAEKQDLLIYLSDTHKMLHGVRCRFYSMEDSIEILRDASARLEQEVFFNIELDKREAHERMLDANRHALAVRRAKKPLPRSFKPFANLKEILV